jgi:signal transduction histidine kinase
MPSARFAKRFPKGQEVHIEFHSDAMPERLSQDVSLCLFRILQEALQNAFKQSGSRQYRVWLRNRANGIELVVQDSGRGFDSEQALNGPGLGLTSMRERLKLVGGTLSIESEHGTTIYARVPLILESYFHQTRAD